MAIGEDLEDILERAFWRLDALHKAHYRDVAPDLRGPMSERDALIGLCARKGIGRDRAFECMRRAHVIAASKSEPGKENGT